MPKQTYAYTWTVVSQLQMITFALYTLLLDTLYVKDMVLR